ncbi:MAG: hypothetical protein ACRDRM_02345, partial [Pseudonocardiaceae bacterium]
RGIEQIGRCFEGLEMVDPSLVSITQWRPDTAEVGEGEPMDAAVPWPASRESPPRTTWTSSRHRLAACADVPAVCLGPTPALTLDHGRRALVCSPIRRRDGQASVTRVPQR